MNITQKYSKQDIINSIFFYSFILLSVFYLGHFIDIQPLIAQGDHGRDYYAFEQTMKGAAPYQDYWWVYGPIMPYYYALFYQFLGVQVPSLLIGQSFLFGCSAVLLYSCLFLLTSSSAIAFLGGFYFLLYQGSFFYTFNHMGGIFFICLNLLLVTLYYKNQKSKYLYFGLFTNILLSLVKLNFGILGLAWIVFSKFVIDWQQTKNFFKDKLFYILACAVPVVIFLIYWFSLRGMPLYYIRQCLPYLAEDHPHNHPPLQNIGWLFSTVFQKWTTSPFNFFMVILCLFPLVQLIKQIFTWSKNSQEEKNHIVILSLIFFYFILNIHEFVASGVWYRTFWSHPAFFLFVFLLIAKTITYCSKTMKLILVTLISGLICFISFLNIISAKNLRTEDRYFAHPKMKVYTANSSQWLDTSLRTSMFLSYALQNENETFFALPYDPIYYYLTDRTSPVKELILFDHINIPVDQELEIISNLEEKNVNWILISSRLSSTEQGLGTFGKTYCPNLANYIYENFHAVTEHGPWGPYAGWTDNHGVIIYKRDKKSLKTTNQ